MQFPRTVLLSWQAPDGRYAGAEVLKRIATRLPKGAVKWAYLGKEQGGNGLPGVECRGFMSSRLHWRLQDTSVGYFYADVVQAWHLARRIADWVKTDSPEVIWVLAELGAVNVARHLHAMLGVPIWVTMHDAYECADMFVPPIYARIYPRYVRRLLRIASGLDAVSAELMQHLSDQNSHLKSIPTLVMPPSVPAAWMGRETRATNWKNTNVRRIGFCGSVRVSIAQMKAFLMQLRGLQYEFKFLAFSDSDLFDHVNSPPNVKVITKSYVPNEASLIKAFDDEKLDAAYLGLWKGANTQPAKEALFARTSLSSKLTTYGAAGVPIIVDAPEDSVAWRLVRQYGAGTLIGVENTKSTKGRGADRHLGDPGSLAVNDLLRFFSDEQAWLDMASGSTRMCREEFDLDRNVALFTEMLLQTSGRKRSNP